MMLRFLSKYKLLLAFVYLTVFTALGSTPMNEVFHFSTRANQVFALLLYVPFMAAVCWKLSCDLKQFHKSAVNILYYIFGLYYICLSTIRILFSMEVKENLYYAIVLFGSLSIWLQIQDGRFKMDGRRFISNLTGILMYTIAVKILATSLTGVVFTHEPLNNLYTTSMLVMLIPFMVDTIRKEPNSKVSLHLVLLAVSLILVLLCTSRAVAILSLVVLAVMLFIHVRERVTFIKVAMAILCAIAVVIGLAAFHIGPARYSLSREFGIIISSGQLDDDPSNPFDELEDEQIYAQEQIERSDSMRSVLLAQGLGEVKKNPLFGTGDLFYTYDLGYKTMEQTAHNFLVESMVTFGLVGTLFLVAIVFFMLRACGLFVKGSTLNLLTGVSILLVLFYYFAFGMVQPSVYNALVCPLFASLIAFYSCILPKATTCIDE